MKTRLFLIKDIDCEMIVEVTTRKDVLSWMDEFLDNLKYDWFVSPYDSYSILYKDGSMDYISEEYDGHKIRRTNIVSIVYTNECTDMVFGNFEINEYGVVTPAFDTVIDNTNIVEL